MEIRILLGDKELRAEFLYQTFLIERSLDRPTIKALKGTEEDLSSPNYLKLKQQLQYIKQLNEEFRFLYLMGRRADGKVFFYVDSEPPDSKDYSPPGQVYEDADQDDLNAFEGIPWVGGPFQDQWGTFMSTLAPVVDPEEGKVMAVFGIDVYSKNWELLVLKRVLEALFPVIIAIIVVISAMFMVSSSKARQRALEEARESDQRLTRLLENAKDMIYRWEVPSQSFSYINPAIKAILEIEPEDVYKDPLVLFQRVLEEDRRLLLDSLNGKGGGNGSITVRFLNARKELVYTEHRLLGIRDHSGLLVAVEGTARDVTERVRDQEELKASQYFLRLVLDTIPVRVFWKDRESRYLGCNRLFLEDAGLKDPEEITGKDDFQMPWKDQAELYRADDLEVITKGLPKQGIEEPQTTLDGSTIWLRTSKVPLKDRSGNTIGVLGTYEDITERRRLLEATERAHRLEALGNLAAGIAHDFNNLLQGVFGFVDLERLRAKDPEVVALLSRAFEMIDTARGLTRQLLTFSKGGEPRKERLPLFPFLEEQIRFFVSGSGVHLKFHKEEGPLWADYDKTQLAQVLMNLVVNSVEAMGRKGSMEVWTGSESFTQKGPEGLEPGE
jgi:PAS domain S-box-containing protein